MKTILLTLSILFGASAAFCQSSCDDAQEVGIGTHLITTLNNPLANDMACNLLDQGDLVNWYAYTPALSGEIIVTTSLSQNGNWDSHLNVLTGECSGLTCVGTNDDGGTGFTSELTFSGIAGTTYYIVFDNRWSTNGGDFYVGNDGDEIENYVDPNGSGGGGGGGGGTTDLETIIEFESTSIANMTSGDCVVDMNGDFLDDVVSVGWGDSDVTVSYQQPDGTFIQEILTGPNPQYSPSWSITAGDLDGNGFNDLMYGAGSGVSIMMRSDDGTELSEWATSEYVFSQRGNMVDIDNDGILDAFMCHDVAPNVYMISDGEGGFTYFQGGLGETENGGNYGSIWIDYNNDCLVDLFIAKCRGGNSPANINQMHRNNGDGTFTEVQEEIGLDDNVQTWSSAWADYDNDGDMDVFVGASSTTNGSHKLMRNDDGIFTDITAETGILASMPTGIEHCAHDYNNDGYVDIDISGTTILINNGDMTFTHSSSAANNGPVGDLNNDGYLDVMGFGGSGVYLNQGSGNNFIKVNTIGTESNKNGIGARITVSSALGDQIRDVKSGDGFGNMSSITAHFGLAQDEIIDLITVCWPSGNVTTLENVAVNTTLNIVEVDGSVLGIQEELSQDFNIYPNPTAEFLNIDSKINYNSFPLEILDLSGRVVIDTMIKDNRVNVEELSSGSYIARINANGVYHQVQFIKE